MKQSNNITMEKVELEEEALAEWDMKLADPEEFKVLSTEEGFYDRYEAQKKLLEEHMSEWESLEKKILLLKKKLV